MNIVPRIYDTKVELAKMHVWCWKWCEWKLLLSGLKRGSNNVKLQKMMAGTISATEQKRERARERNTQKVISKVGIRSTNKHDGMQLLPGISNINIDNSIDIGICSCVLHRTHNHFRGKTYLYGKKNLLPFYVGEIQYILVYSWVKWLWNLSFKSVYLAPWF